MSWVNKIFLQDISIREMEPFNVTIKSLPDSGNIIVSAKRFVGDLNTNGISIIAKVSISGKIVAVAAIWDDAETPTPGKYRIQVVARDSSSVIKKEFNAIVNVTH